MHCPDFRIIQLEEADSTNTYLKQLCDSREVDAFTVVTAKNQTAGRGQRGNYWESEPGKNLTFSLLARPTFIRPKEQFLISQAISLCIKEELDQFAPGFSIKWPNDIYWNESKICGILIENNLSGDFISESIMGAGVNINQQEFRSPAPNPISLRQITGNEYDCTLFLSGLLKRFGKYYQELKSLHSENIVSNYHNSLFRKDGFHKYKDKKGIFFATIVGTEPDGTFILKDSEGKRRSYLFKEVSFVLD